MHRYSSLFGIKIQLHLNSNIWQMGSTIIRQQIYINVHHKKKTIFNIDFKCS